jgi:ABC-type hemin transport system substrate-binding protein
VVPRTSGQTIRLGGNTRALAYPISRTPLPAPAKETVETLYLLGEQHRIVGISGYVVRPPQARREKPRVSVFTSPNIDKIFALRPDRS